MVTWEETVPGHKGGEKRDMTECYVSRHAKGKYAVVYPTDEMLRKSGRGPIITEIGKDPNGRLTQLRYRKATADESGTELRGDKADQRPRYDILVKKPIIGAGRTKVSYRFANGWCTVDLPPDWKYGSN